MAGYGAQYTRQTLYTVAAAVGAGVFYYALRLVLLSHLDIEEYGLFYHILSAAMMLYPVLSFGFDPGIVPFVTRFREEKDYGSIKSAALGALAFQSAGALLLAAVVWALAGPIATRFYGDAAAVWLIRLVAVHAVLNMVFTNGSAVLLGLQSIGARCVADLARIVVCLGAAILLLRLGYGAEAAAIGYTVGALGGALMEGASLALWHADVVRAPASWRPALVGQVFRSGAYLSVASGGVLIFSQMDTVMLGMLKRDLRLTGAYQVAVPTLMIIYGLLLALGSCFMPMVTTLIHRGERAKLAEGVARVLEAAIVTLLPAGVVAACFSDVLMRALWRQEVPEALTAFNVLAVGAAFYFTSYLNLQVLGGLGKTRSACAAIAASLGVNLVLNVVLILLMGVRGAALATVCSHLAATGLTLAFIRRELPVKPRLALLPVTAGVCVAVWWGAEWVRQTPVYAEYSLAVALATGVTLYGASLVILEGTGLSRLRELARIMTGKTKGRESGA